MIILLRKNLVLIFICVISVSYGQNAIGGKIGFNLATYTGDTEDIDNKGSNFGLQIGAAFEIGVNDLISIQPELLYIQKGVKSESTDEFSGITAKSKVNVVFNYLELPVLVKVKFGNLESTNYFLTVGPSFGYALDGKLKSEISFGGETEKEEMDFEFEDDDGFSRFDLSAALGAGVNFPVGPGKLFVEARYVLGLSNLVDDDRSDEKIRNGGLGLGVGFMVPIGK